MSPKTYFFSDDGVIPNNVLPVILYRQVVDSVDCSDWLEERFKENMWLNNWRDVVLPYDHFHSNTHEVLGLGRGSVSLKIGGAHGQIIDLRAGDVILIPAGVGHYSIVTHTDYLFVGGYPNGQAWDLKTGLEEEDRSQIIQSIAGVELPEKDPVLGNEGLMFEKWVREIRPLG
jgi:uncharacterized protein YjlB